MSSVFCEQLFSAAKEIATAWHSQLGSERFEELQVLKFLWRKDIVDMAAVNADDIEVQHAIGVEFEEFKALDERLRSFDDVFRVDAFEFDDSE